MAEILDDAVDQHPVLSFVWNSILLFFIVLFIANSLNTVNNMQIFQIHNDQSMYLNCIGHTPQDVELEYEVEFKEV